MPQEAKALTEQEETNEVDEQSMAAAGEFVLGRARDKGLSPVTHYAYDEALGIHNAREKQRLLEQHRPGIEALALTVVPGMPPVDLDVFHLYKAATAMPLLAARARRAAGEPEPRIVPVIERLMVIRNILLPTLQGAAAAGQVPKTRVDDLIAGRGYRNYVMDVVESLDIMDGIPAVFGNHPTVTPEIKKEGKTLSYEVLPELPVEGVEKQKTTPEQVTKTRDERSLGYAFLLAMDAEADRLLSIFLGPEAKKQVPSLQQGRNAGRTSKAAAPAQEPAPAE